MIVLLTTFGLTVIFDLTIAIQVGMVLAVFLFMRRMAIVTNVGIITRELKDDDELFDANAITSKKVPKDVEVFEINGPFFFGAVSKFLDAIRIIETPPKVLIIRMRNVPAVDGTGIHTLEEVYHNVVKKGTQLILSGVHIQVPMVLEQSGFLKIIGVQNVLGNIDDSLDRAREILGLPKIGRPVDFEPTVKRDIT